MAVVIKNTFLDIADHKFLYFEEPCCIERRCHSVPRTWKPVTPCNGSRKPVTRCNGSRKRTFSRSSSSSTESDLSFCSTVESFEAVSPSDDASMKHQFEIPGAIPHCLIEQKTDSWDWCHDCVSSAAETDIASNTESYDTTQVSDKDTYDEVNACNAGTWTRLKSKAPAFQPMATNSRLDAVAHAVYLALVSSGQTCQVKIEKGIQGALPTSITAEVPSGPRGSSRCYDAVHLARQTLEEITSRLDAVMLLSKRVQKEERGYSLRSTIACIANGAEDGMCWDLFHHGYCPRRSNCHWYHPQETDTGRIKVSIRCAEDVSGLSSEGQLQASFPADRHKISLGELV